MANKLRDVFTDNKGILMRGTVSFKDKKAEKQFTDALKKVYQRGESVQVEGVESVSMGIESGSQLFPFEQVSGDITHFMVGPSYERKDYQIEIDGEETIFPLLYCRLEDGIIIRTDTEEIVFLKLTVSFKQNKTKVEITPHYEKANNIAEIIESIKKVESFLKRFFSGEAFNISQEYASILKHIGQTRFIYELAQFTETEYGVQFEIPQIDLNDKDSVLDLYELMLVTKRKVAIRMNAEVKPNESTMIELQGDYREEIGHAITLVSRGDITYSIWGTTITLYSANMLCDAVVKEIIKLENGHTKILYGDTEQRSMYVSYKAYRNEEKAIEETKHIMVNQEEYVKAKTAAQYWTEEVG